MNKSIENIAFASPVEVLRSVKVFVGDYGAMQWNLSGDMAKQVFNAWNTCIKHAWQVPRSTQTSLRSSPDMKVSVMVNLVARDVRTATGNLHHVGEVSDLDPVQCSPKQVKAVFAETCHKS